MGSKYLLSLTYKITLYNNKHGNIDIWNPQIIDKWHTPQIHSTYVPIAFWREYFRAVPGTCDPNVGLNVLTAKLAKLLWGLNQI